MKEIIVANQQLAVETIKDIKKFQNRMKKMEEEYKGFMARLLQVMEENNIIKVEADGVTITYIAPTDRESFDSKAFRKEHQDLYDEFTKIVPVKSSVRISVK